MNYFNLKLKPLDFFGSDISLNFNKENKFRTQFGAVMSMIFMTFVGIFFWNSILSFIRREVIYVETNKEYIIDSPPFDMNSKVHMFAVKLDQDNFITRPFFNVVWETRDYVTLSNGTKIKNKYKKPLVPCTFEHWKHLPEFNVNWQEVYDQVNLSSFLCPRIEDAYKLGGGFNSDHFYHTKISVSKCKQSDFVNSTYWKPQCANQTEFDSYFKSKPDIRVQIYINNFIFNPTKKSNHIQSFLDDSIFYSIQKNDNAYQTADVFFTEHRVSTDQSIMPYSQIEEKSILIYEFGNIRSQYVMGITSDTIADFYFRKNPVQINISRNYQKLGQIISFIGGFSQLMIAITAFIVKYYNQHVYLISLANKIYDFQLDEQKRNDGDNSPKKLDNLSICSPSSKSPLGKIEQFDGSYVRKKRNFFSQNKDQLKLQLHQSTLTNTQVENIKAENSIQFNQSDYKSDENNKNIEINDDLERNIQKIKHKMSIHTPAKKGQKVVSREQEGLVPLKDLIQIIKLKKEETEQQYPNRTNNLINQQQTEQNRKSTFNKNDDKTNLIKNINNEQILSFEEIQNPHMFEDNQKNSFSEQLKRFQKQMTYDTNSNSNSYSNSPIKFNSPSKEELFKNIQSNSKKIIPKLIKKDSINPETPTNTKEQQDIPKNQKNCSQNKENENLEIIPELHSHNTYDSPKINGLQKSTNRFEIALNRATTQSQSGMLSFQKRNTTVAWGQKILQKLGLQDRNEFLDKEFQFLIKRDTSISLSFKYFLNKLTCGKLFRSNLIQLINRAIKQMKKELDIFDILNRLKQIDKLKSLFLDKNQEIVFNFFPKPVLQIEEKYDNLSLAEIADKVRKGSKLEVNKKDNVHIKQKSQKKLNINLKTISTIKKAVKRFKKPLNKQIKKFNSIQAYQKLYESYEQIYNQESEIRTKNLMRQTSTRFIKVQPFMSNQNIESDDNLSHTHLQNQINQSLSGKFPKLTYLSSDNQIKLLQKNNSVYNVDQDNSEQFDRSNIKFNNFNTENKSFSDNLQLKINFMEEIK